ncbi:hypothetical protein BD779DRAFT_1678462 [Infundibulicybe gibba]|nr:hypothetical protein BD779DRAFT_1678462 [Infundibulicybe gibba]
MTPKRWTNKEQRRHLEGEIDAYLEAKKSHNLTDFWDRMHREWFELWPESEGDEADEGEKIEDRKEQLKTWFRNNTGDKGRKAARATPIIVGVPRKQTRLLRPEEMYARLRYKGELQETVANEIKEQNVGLGSEEVREFILKEVAAQRRHQSDEVEKTPQAYAEIIAAIPTILSQVFEDLAEKSGWSFDVVCGGPDPENGGRVRTMGFHQGKNKIGQSFSQAYPGYKETVLRPFSAFLKSVYSPSTCEARALHREEAST